MKKLSYTLTIKTPLIISDTVGGNNHISTADFIAGSSILGVIAGRFLQANTPEIPEQDKTFKRLFLSDAVCYRNATINIRGDRSIPVPLNIVKKKGKDDVYVDVFIGGNEKNTKKVSGYLGSSLIKSPNKTINFHTSRKDNRLSGKSEDGEIFTYEGLSEGQQFTGDILGEEDDLNTIKSLFSRDKTIRIGRSKTAQYGEATIIFSDVIIPENAGQKTNIFSLISPAIVLNNNGISSTLLKDLEIHLGVKIKRAIVRTTVVESYNRKWGTKKPSEVAYAPGSVFEIEGDISGALINGIGIRRNEGFGEIATANIIPSKIAKDKSGSNVKKPNGKPPETVLNIFKTTVKKECTILAEHAAIFDKITPKMPNALTTRLLAVFQAESPMNEILAFVAKTQTQKDDESSVVKKAGEHLKRVKLKGKSLFDILADAKSEPGHFYNERIKDKTTFLETFPKEVGIKPESFKEAIWIHYWKLLLTSHMKEK